jgi:hypothetical protein
MKLKVKNLFPVSYQERLAVKGIRLWAEKKLVKGDWEEYVIAEKEALKSKIWEKIMPEIVLSCHIKNNLCEEI